MTTERREINNILKEACSLPPQDFSGDVSKDPIVDRLLEIPDRESHKKPIC